MGPGRGEAPRSLRGRFEASLLRFSAALCPPWLFAWLKSFFWPRQTEDFFPSLGSERLQRRALGCLEGTEQRLCRSPGAPRRQERSGAAAAQSPCEPGRAGRENSPGLQPRCFACRDRARGARPGEEFSAGRAPGFHLLRDSPWLVFPLREKPAPSCTACRERGFLRRFGSFVPGCV